MDRPRVALGRTLEAVYPDRPPFDPDDHFPELKALPGGHPPISELPSPAYSLVRSTLALYGLDAENFGTGDWNPLGRLVPSTGLVVLKPNLVLESNEEGQAARQALTTHGSVIRVLVDYIHIAAGANVRILIGDVPLQGADFDRVVQQNGLRETVEILKARGYDNLELLDLRRERAIVDEAGFITRLEKLDGDPNGYVEVDVGSLSRLEELSPEKLESVAVTDYRERSTRSAHRAGHHVYLIPRSVLEADLLINLPKLKTHQKAGLTVAIKNLVGINGDKARIPHFRVGGEAEGGDEYPPNRLWIRKLMSRTQSLLQGRSKLLYHLARSLWRAIRPVIVGDSKRRAAPGASTLASGGAWFGNDTLWRALHDLNYILCFADSEGRLQQSRQRKYLCVVDGIVAGEGDGPLRPSPRRDGIVLIGDDPLAVDLVSAQYMGFDWRQIPQLARALSARPAWTRVVQPISESGGVDIVARNGTPLIAEEPFKPPPGWLDHVELGHGAAHPAA